MDSAKDVVGERPETNHLRYKLLREIVASTARVVSELCAARIRGMAFSDLDLTSLGDVVDVRDFFLINLFKWVLASLLLNLDKSAIVSLYGYLRFERKP